jgi:hypothetical protein
MAALLGALGVWLLWPGILWILSNGLFASSAAWLTSGLDYLNYETSEALGLLWNGAVSMQGAIGSNLAMSTVIGAGLVCAAIFLAIDPAAWRPIPDQHAAPTQSAILTSGLHP